MPNIIEFDYKNASVKIKGEKVSEDEETITVLLKVDVVVMNRCYFCGEEQWFWKERILGDVKITGQHEY